MLWTVSALADAMTIMMMLMMIPELNSFLIQRLRREMMTNMEKGM